MFDDTQDVYSMNADGTDRRRLTSDPAPEFDPTWSPDGSQVAYRVDVQDHAEIWVMNADGTDRRKLGDGLSPAWAPRDSRIAFADSDGYLSIIRADGTGRQRVPGTREGEYPTWSPDGNRLMFNTATPAGHLMYAVDVDGSDLIDISKVAGEGWQAAWSPDGTRVAFQSRRDGPDGDVYLMEPDGSGVRRLTSDGGFQPAWSPDGRYLVYCTSTLRVTDPVSGAWSITLDDAGRAGGPDWTS